MNDIGRQTNSSRQTVRTDGAHHLQLGAIASQSAETCGTLSEHQNLVQQTLDAVKQPVALCDARTVLLNCNKAWREFDDGSHSFWPSLSVGANIIEACDAATPSRWPHTHDLAAGLQTVLNGEFPTLTIEYARPSTSGVRRFQINARALRDAGAAKLVVVCEETATCDLIASTSQKNREDLASALAELSHRERQILELVLEGEPNKSIALLLDLSQKTVEKHRSSLMRKLGAQNVVQLVRKVLGQENLHRV